MRTLVSDVRHALRLILKSPGVAAVAVLSLALGIGANTAIFSVVHAVILKPLPFPRPDAIVSLEERNRDGSPSGQTGWATYADWRTRSRSLSEVAVASYWDPKLSAAAGEAEKLEGLRVSDGFFRVLGIRPALGRDFLPEEDRQGAPRVAILSHGLWQRRFGGDPALVGRTVSISDIPFTIVGVLPADFESIFSPLNYKPAEIWSPLRYDASLKYACRTCRHLQAFGRLREGVSIERARAEMDAISATLFKEHPADYGAAGVVITPIAKKVTATLRPVLWALLGAVAFVLLIACANVASLLLAQAASRRREIAIRTALGAGRGRIGRMFVTEALLLACAGGALGVLTSVWSLDALVRLAPGNLPRLAGVHVDGTVLLFSLAISLATGVLFGLGPALALSGQDPQVALRDGGGSGRGRSLRSMGLLVSFDAALAFLLLFGAGLLVRSTARLLARRSRLHRGTRPEARDRPLRYALPGGRPGRRLLRPGPRADTGDPGRDGSRDRQRAAARGKLGQLRGARRGARARQPRRRARRAALWSHAGIPRSDGHSHPPGTRVHRSRPRRSASRGPRQRDDGPLALAGRGPSREADPRRRPSLENGRRDRGERPPPGPRRRFGQPDLRSLRAVGGLLGESSCCGRRETPVPSRPPRCPRCAGSIRTSPSAT